MPQVRASAYVLWELQVTHNTSLLNMLLKAICHLPLTHLRLLFFAKVSAVLPRVGGHQGASPRAAGAQRRGVRGRAVSGPLGEAGVTR